LPIANDGDGRKMMLKFKVVMVAENGVIGREAMFSHLDDAQDMATMWCDFAPDLTIKLLDEAGEVQMEWPRA
jgi:hypothetical protein